MDAAKEPRKAAIYLRTSTVDQHTENQKPDVYALIKARGFEIIDVFEEQGSAAVSVHGG